MDRPLPNTPPALEADRLIASGRAGWRLGRFGARGRALGRALARVMHGRAPYDQTVDRLLLDALGHVDARVTTLVARLDARDQDAGRLSTALEERLRIGEDLADDLALATERLRERVAALAVRVGDPDELPRIEDLLAAARARPYVHPSFATWDEPGAGTVMGFRHSALARVAPAARYKLFEDRFRGPEERVTELQRHYLPLLEADAPVLDVGCGRGEMLDLLRERGIASYGVDVDEGMIARCAAKGHVAVEVADAAAHLSSVEAGHYGSIFCAQVVEHMPYAALSELLVLAASRLRPGGLLILETVNPHAPHALRAFWTDLTHQHPIFPEVALALCELAGFASAYVFHPTGTGTVEVDSWTESAYAVVARSAVEHASTDHEPVT